MKIRKDLLKVPFIILSTFCVIVTLFMIVRAVSIKLSPDSDFTTFIKGKNNSDYVTNDSTTGSDDNVIDTAGGENSGVSKPYLSEDITLTSPDADPKENAQIVAIQFIQAFWNESDLEFKKIENLATTEVVAAAQEKTKRKSYYIKEITLESLKPIESGYEAKYSYNYGSKDEVKREEITLNLDEIPDGDTPYQISSFSTNEAD